jgi:DNA-directed RNA polymerase specialized sigma24 family protein
MTSLMKGFQHRLKLRFFAGLTMPEIAQVLKISLATAERHWTYARTWLYAELKDRENFADR